MSLAVRDTSLGGFCIRPVQTAPANATTMLMITVRQKMTSKAIMKAVQLWDFSVLKQFVSLQQVMPEDKSRRHTVKARKDPLTIKYMM